MNIVKFFLGCLFVLPLMSPSAAQAQFGDLLKGMKDAAKELEKGMQQVPQPKPAQPAQQPTEPQQLAQVLQPSIRANAFVWENTDEKRTAWRVMIRDAVTKECNTTPTVECVRNSSVMQLIREVCERVPPNVRPEDHRDIFRASCLSDAESGASRALAEVTDKQRVAKEVARQEALRASQQSKLDERKRKQEFEQKEIVERERQRELALEQQIAMAAKQDVSCLTSILPKVLKTNPPPIKAPSRGKLQCGSKDAEVLVDRVLFDDIHGSADGEIDLASALTGIPIASSIRSPGRTPIAWYEIKLDGIKEVGRSPGKTPDGKTVEVVECQADVYFKIRHPEVLACAQSANLLQQSRLNPKDTPRQNEEIVRFQNNPDLWKRVGGQVSYTINPETTPLELQKGFPVAGTVQYMITGLPELRSIGNTITRQFSFYPLSHEFARMRNSTPWSSSYLENFNGRCAAAGHRSRACACYRSEMESRFSFLQMNQLHYASYHVFDTMTAPERASWFFPFKVSAIFGRLYPDAKEFLNRIESKCNGL